MIENVLSQTGNPNTPSAAPYNSGVWPDLHPLNNPLWRTGTNVLFKNGGVEKMGGWGNPFTKPASTPVRGMLQRRESGVQELYFGNPTTIYKWNTGTPTAVGTGYTGNTDSTVTVPASVWSMVDWGTWVLATNGVDVPQIYKGSSFTTLNVGTEFTTAEILIKRGPYVLAFNTTGVNTYNGINAFHWCSDDDVEDWTPTSVNTAGNQMIRDMTSGIKAAVPLGDRIAVYGTDSMYLVAYTGAPFYFGYYPALNGIGAVSKAAVVSVGRKNFGFGPSGIWETDGAQFKYIDPGIHDYIYDAFNDEQKEKVCGYHDEFNTQVCFYYPTTTGEPTVGVGYNYMDGTWSIFNHGRTSALERDVFTWPVLATSTGDIFFHNFGLNADSAGMTVSVESELLDLGSGNIWKYIDAIRFHISRLAGTVNFYLGTAERRDDSITWENAQVLDDGDEPLFYNLSARYIALKIETTALASDFKVEGHTIYGEGATHQS